MVVAEPKLRAWQWFEYFGPTGILTSHYRKKHNLTRRDFRFHPDTGAMAC
jgi:hypothetical protein